MRIKPISKVKPRQMSLQVKIEEIKKLQNAHQELLAFFNVMDEVFFSVNMVNQRVIQISNGCEKLYGYSAAEFLSNGISLVDFVHPDDRPIIAANDVKLRRGEKVDQQDRMISRDGTIKWVESNIVPTLDEFGVLVRIDGITRDITVRKIADEKNRQGEARYRMIVENSQEGIWTIDEREKTNFVNQRMSDMLGYTSSEMIGKELYDFMDAEGKAYAIACMERRRNGARENLDIRYVTKNGEDVWANISANPIFDSNGKYLGALAMVTDVTQRKHDEDALRKSEANLRAIFENTDSAYILINEELKIVSFNVQAQKYSEEYNRISLKVNEHVRDYFSAERWPYIQQTLTRVAAGDTVSYELSFAKEDGSTKWHDVRWLNVKNSDNKNVGFILANSDITETKLTALERERITVDLTQHIKDLEQFTYIISHNLRAPVANIIGLSDMLKEDILEPAEKEDVLERVSVSIKNIDTVIQDLNQILQARDLVNERKEMVYFDNLVEGIKTSIHNTIETEKIQIRRSFYDVDSLFTIRSYMYSIFYNLVSNSIKYRRNDVATVINIESRKLNNKVELRFRDNGKGIDLDKNGHLLFGLYKRFDTTMEGKGLGLFMVKTQVEALGGTIQINSKLGEGAEFIIHFPV